MACWLSRNWWIFIQTVQHQLRQKYFFREFKRQQQQSTNFFSSRIISSCVSYSEGEDIFLFVCLVVCFCVMYFCVCLSFLSCFMCYRLSYLLSQEVFRMSAYFPC